MDAHKYTPEDRELVSRLLANPIEFPYEFKQWVTNYVVQNIPPIPISHIAGYENRRAHFSEVIDDAGTVFSSLTDNWGDQVTSNPSVTGLSDGDYLCIFGCFFEGGAGASSGHIGISVNDGTPDLDHAASGVNLLDDGMYVSAAHIITGVRTAGGGNNSLVAKVRLHDISGSATIRVGSRYLVVMKAK